MVLLCLLGWYGFVLGEYVVCMIEEYYVECVVYVDGVDVGVGY